VSQVRHDQRSVGAVGTDAACEGGRSGQGVGSVASAIVFMCDRGPPAPLRGAFFFNDAERGCGFAATARLLTFAASRRGAGAITVDASSAWFACVERSDPSLRKASDSACQDACQDESQDQQEGEHGEDRSRGASKEKRREQVPAAFECIFFPAPVPNPQSPVPSSLP
jgi:hypothetical protein